MTSIHHQDLRVEQLEDGTIRLLQPDYSGHDAIIDIHPDQLRAIAGRYAPTVIQTTTPADVVLRRFKAVVQAVRDAAWEDATFNDIWERAAEAHTLYTGLNAAMTMADQFIDDSESVITCHAMSHECTNCHGKSDGITVTESRRGQAMTDTEQQAKHREKVRQQVTYPLPFDSPTS